METFFLAMTWDTREAMVLDMIAVGILVLFMIICTTAVVVDGLVEIVDFVKQTLRSPRRPKGLERMNDDRYHIL